MIYFYDIFYLIINQTHTKYDFLMSVDDMLVSVILPFVLLQPLNKNKQ
jgi:hypothetical protein